MLGVAFRNRKNLFQRNIVAQVVDLASRCERKARKITVQMSPWGLIVFTKQASLAAVHAFEVNWKPQWNIFLRRIQNHATRKFFLSFFWAHEIGWKCFSGSATAHATMLSMSRKNVAHFKAQLFQRNSHAYEILRHLSKGDCQHLCSNIDIGALVVKIFMAIFCIKFDSLSRQREKNVFFVWDNKKLQLEGGETEKICISNDD